MDPVTPRSRRAVLAGALGGLAAAAASSLIRPSTAAAADGGPVLLGASDNSATLNTGITNTGGGTVLTSTATGSGYAIVATGNAGRGVSANTQTGSAVRASANGAGYGVYSTSTTGTGVLASSTSGVALRVSSGAQAAAISSTSVSAPSLVSKATGGTIGVVGIGGNFAPAAYPGGGIGVLGDNPAAGGVGVWGRSTAGSALVGDSVTGYGVEAYGSVGVFGSGDFAGVIGDVDGSTGVQGWSGALTAPDPGVHVGVWAGAENGRTALKVQGVTRMNRSGRASIASTKSSIKVTVPGGISSTSMGFANLQTNRAGYYVQAVALGTTDSSITIYLNKALTTATYVSWLVIDRP
jgi:hypothetical protein